MALAWRRGGTGGAHLLRAVQPTRGAGLGRRGASALAIEALALCAHQGHVHRLHVPALARIIIAHLPTMLQVVGLLRKQDGPARRRADVVARGLLASVRRSDAAALVRRSNAREYVASLR